MTASSSAVRHVTSGTYHRDIIIQRSLTFTAGTEWEVPELATNIVADDGRDALFSWVRCVFWVYDEGTRHLYEWFVIRCDKDEALQDMNTDSVVENLHKQGRILRRDIVQVFDPEAGNIKKNKFELYNVKLDDDEELRLVVRPITTGGASAGAADGVLEWREVGD